MAFVNKLFRATAVLPALIWVLEVTSSEDCDLEYNPGDERFSHLSLESHIKG